MTDRDWLLRDAMRLEDAQPDSLKGLWVVTRGDEVCLVPALTAPGARAVLETLELAGPGDDLTLSGPVDRRAFTGLEQHRWYGRRECEEWMAGRP